MNPENQKHLLEKYPKLYSGYYKSKNETCMVWGFSCGDGWFDLIDKLSMQIDNVGIDIEVRQVKEKFGTLRYYWDPAATDHNDNMDGDKFERKYNQVIGAVSFADQLSVFICEQCGKFDSEVKPKANGGWVHNKCAACQEPLI